MTLSALEDTICVCFVQLRSSLMRNPRHFASWTRNSTTPSIMYSLCSLFLSTLATAITTHFDGLNHIPQVETQRPSCFRSYCTPGLLRTLWCGIPNNHWRNDWLVMSHVQEGHWWIRRIAADQQRCIGVPPTLLMPMMMLLHPPLLVATCFGGNQQSRHQPCIYAIVPEFHHPAPVWYSVKRIGEIEDCYICPLWDLLS